MYHIHVSKRALYREIRELVIEGSEYDKSTVFGKRLAGLCVSEGCYDIYLDLSKVSYNVTAQGKLLDVGPATGWIPLGRFHKKSERIIGDWNADLIFTVWRDIRMQKICQAEYIVFVPDLAVKDSSYMTDARFEDTMEEREIQWFKDHLMSYDLDCVH